MESGTIESYDESYDKFFPSGIKIVGIGTIGASALTYFDEPLFIEDIRQAKKCLLVFVGNLESFSMLEANEAATFLGGELRQSENILDGVLLQVVHDDTANYSAMAFVLATDFIK